VGVTDSLGFTFASGERFPSEPVQVCFKARLRIFSADGWWTYSLGRATEAASFEAQ